MGYRVRYYEDMPVRELPEGGYERGVIAVFTAHVRGEVSQAVVPLPLSWWEQHQAEARIVAKQTAARIFAGMRP